MKLKAVYVGTVLAGLALATACGVGCSSSGQPTSSESTGTLTSKLSFYEWQNQVDRENFPVIKYTLSNATTGFHVSGSTNSTVSHEIEGIITGIPVGPGYTLSLSATSKDGAWTCAGSTTRTFKETCTDNDGDDELRVNLLCQNKWIRSWHRTPVIGEINVECLKDAGVDAAPDAAPDAAQEACVPFTVCPNGDNCGTIPNGCGGTLTCAPNSCAAPQSCGGGGVPNQCGCTAKTCSASQNCGTISNGCGGTITCGSLDGGACPTGQVCNSSNSCVCQPITACPAADNCGTVPDTCGGNVTCGTMNGNCASGLSCVSNVCVCVPQAVSVTCGNKVCGSATDNCGNVVNCGPLNGACPSSQTCDATGSCVTCATSCPSGDTCGTVTNPAGCSQTTISCGTCTGTGQTCGGGPTHNPNVCGCIPTTAACGTHTCGTAADGCGGTINCGSNNGGCAANQTCDSTGTCVACATTCPAGDTCGTVVNNCGTTLNCGTCPTNPPNESCGGGTPGMANHCGCTPTPAATACGSNTCGSASDGCGGTVNCGTLNGACPANQTCNASGQCVACATTCPMGDTCGTVVNNCGTTITCGTCMGTGQTCGGGPTHNPNVCGCIPQTAAQACGSQNCGSAPDGCGGTLSCGPLNGACQAGFACNASGVCICQALTACPPGDNCGTIPDTCGGNVTCQPNNCAATGVNQTCGGGGTANVCGCTPKSVTAACGSSNCGTASDGCGGTVICGTCTDPANPNCAVPAGSTAGTCGPAICTTRTTCAAQGATCGSISDGCGGTLNCGTCQAGFTCGGGGALPNQCGSSCSGFNTPPGAAPVGCSATEQKFVNKSVDCYTCLVNNSCLDDAIFADTNNECEDLGNGTATAGDAVGQPLMNLCFNKIDCVISTACASTDVSACYCGTLAGSTCATSTSPGNGACAEIEAEGVNHSGTDPASTVSVLLGNKNSAAGKSDAIFACSVVNGCGPLCNQ